MPDWDRAKSLLASVRWFAAKVFEWISAGYDLFIEAALRCTIRLALWALTIVVALAPLLYVADVRPSFDITAMATKINNAGLFRDLIYVLVVISILGLCEVLSVLLRKLLRPKKARGNEGAADPNVARENNETEHTSPTVLLIYTLAIVGFIISSGLGMSEFAHLATPHGVTHIAPKEQFEYDMNLLVGVGIVGLFLELLLAFQGE